ncbi:LPXTG cell wall anchor domain-containing protein [Paenibacillus camerounensis]|nr:LPXTG cell wall anchor domain-containing protein [Paenibacillus camerounensis]
MGNIIFISPATTTGDMLTAILVSAGFAAVMLGLSYLVFRRTELK